MITRRYNPVPCDEPPPARLRAAAAREADMRGVPVRIKDEQGRLFEIHYPESFT